MAKSRKKRNRASGRVRVARSRSRNVKRYSARRRSNKGYTIRRRSRNPIMKAHRRRRRSSNPFATSISLSRPTGLITAGVGVLVGVAATKFLVSLLPASIAGNTLYATVAGFAAAAVEWWLLSLVSPEFGAAAGLGGIAEAGSIALSNFMPSLGSLALSGRGTGNFVPGRFAVPQNPILDAATGQPKFMSNAVRAYPMAYSTQ